MLIGISGKKFAGKDTTADCIINQLEELFELEGLDFKIQKLPFAGTLKEMCINMFGLTPEQCYDPKEKEVIDFRYGKTPRRIMQEVGCKLREVWPDVWVENTIRKYKKGEADISIITDCRFPNEVQRIKSEGGKILRVNRNLPSEDFDASEIALDNWEDWDYIIENNGTIEDLNKAITDSGIIEYLFNPAGLESMKAIYDKWINNKNTTKYKVNINED